MSETNLWPIHRHAGTVRMIGRATTLRRVPQTLLCAPGLSETHARSLNQEQYGQHLGTRSSLSDEII